jgi:hypothetical protein
LYRPTTGQLPVDRYNRPTTAPPDNFRNIATSTRTASATTVQRHLRQRTEDRALTFLDFDNDQLHHCDTLTVSKDGNFDDIFVYYLPLH